MYKITERTKTPLLGDSKRAEAIVKWSLDNQEGTKYSPGLHTTGITLECVARGESPRVFLYFNPAKLKQVWSQLSELDRLVLGYKGICIKVEGGKANVNLVCLPTKISSLWSGDLSACVDHNLLLGMIELTDTGFNLYAPSECESKPERVEPLAIISKKPLSERSRAYLIRDAALNMMLKKPKDGSVNK